MKIFNLNSGLYLAPIIIFGLLLFRSASIFPVVADEYVYNLYTRQLPLVISKIPNFLYLWIYSHTNFCGESFLSCGKIFNSLFFSLSAPFIYMSSRRYCKTSISLFIAALGMLSPVNSYTAYYMPESLYFLTFWITAWYLLGITYTYKYYQIFLLGCLTGIMSLVKPHAIFLLAPITVYLWVLIRNENLFKECAKALILILTGFTLVKISLGYVIAGNNGITLFGKAYGDILNSSMNSALSISTIELVLRNIFGHFESLIILFGLPLTLIFYNSINSIKSSENINKLDLLILMLLATLILLTSIFTVINDNSLRLHMRYYDFMFPLIYISISNNYYSNEKYNNKLLILIISILILTGVYALKSKMLPYMPDFVDAPDLSGLLEYKNNRVIQIFGLLIIILFLAAKNKANRIYFYIFLPLITLLPAYNVNSILMKYRDASVYIKAGLFLNYYMAPNDLYDTVIVGADSGQLYLENLMIKNRGVTMQPLPKVNYDIKDVPPGKKWILLVGDYEFSKDYFILESQDNLAFKLIKVR